MTSSPVQIEMRYPLPGLPALPLWCTAPNLLTCGRILVAPIAIREILRRRSQRAFFLIGSAAFTDLLDGLVARATASTTALGQYLDPIADKLLLSGTFAGLARIGTAPKWLVGVIFGRDVALLTGSAVIMRLAGTPAQKLRVLTPTLLGKAATLMQIATASVFVAADAWKSVSLRRLGRWLSAPAGLLTAYSGLHYFGRGIQYLRRH